MVAKKLSAIVAFSAIELVPLDPVMQRLLTATQALGYVPNAAASEHELHSFAAKPPADTTVSLMASQTPFRVQATKTIKKPSKRMPLHIRVLERKGWEHDRNRRPMSIRG